MREHMSIRTALIGGMLVLATAVTLIVGTVGVISINRSVLDEAQERVNRDLDTVSALYQQSLIMLAKQIEARALGIQAAGGIDTAGRLEQMRREIGCAILNMCDRSGRPLAGTYSNWNVRLALDTDPVLRQALAGKGASGTVRLNDSRLRVEGGESLVRSLTVHLEGDPTAGIGSALFHWCAYPVRGEDGRVAAVVYGGRALNHNHELVDTMRRTAFGAALYQGKPRGTVTLFLDDVRIATNVLGPEGLRADGTRISPEVRRVVLQEGRRWQAPAWVVDARYLSAYDPLRDPEGNIVGILYVGLLESPYDALRARLLAGFLIPAGIVFVVGLTAAVAFARRIIRPLDSLRDSAQRIAHGDWGGDIPAARTYSEVASLASVFRRMQEAINQRDQQLRAQNLMLAEANERLTQTNSNYMKTLRFVTHELKSPLAAVQMMIDVVVGNLMGEVPERLRHPLIRIKRNCEELQDMVKNYLDLARAEQGELQASMRQIDINEDVVKPVVEQNLALFASRRIKLSVDCPRDLTATADPELMRIALNNYLSNAAKYGQEESEAKLEVVQAGKDIDVRVWNKGAGFEPAESQLLFGKFVRLHNENTRGKRGSGLGLYLCRQVLNLHGGTVRAESQPGQWARFSFRFPRQPR